MSVINGGLISGGLRGGVLAANAVASDYADAVTFTSSDNSLTLNSAQGVSNGGLTGGIGITGSLALRTGNSNVTLSSVIHNVTAAGSIIKQDAGTLTLTGANTYSGGTTISGGTLAISSDGNLGAASGSLTFQGGTLRIDPASNFGINRNTVLNTVGTVEVASGVVDLFGVIADGAGGPGSLIKTGAGQIDVRNANTYTGTTTVQDGTLRVGGGGSLASRDFLITGGDLILDGRVAPMGAVVQQTGGRFIAGASLEIGSLSGSAGSSVVIASNVTLTTGRNGTNDTYGGTIGSDGVGAQAGALIKVGTGTFALTGANNYSGGTTITAGVLNIQAATALGSTALGTTVSGGAALELQGGIAVVPEALNLSGTGIAGNGALRNVSGANSYAGSVTLLAGSRIQSDTGSSLALSGAIIGDQAGRALSLGGAGNIAVSGVISSTIGTVMKDGAGILTLTGANAYTGGTTISAGTLRIGAGGMAGSITGAVTNNAALVFDRSDGLSFGGAISGTGTLEKLGAGTLTLRGANNYTGVTTVTAGTLLVMGSLAAGSAVAVAAGAALGGTGTVAGAVTVDTTGASGGTISAGATALSDIGTLNTGALALIGSNATLRQDVASTTVADKLVVNGSVTLAGTLDLHTTGASFAASVGQSLIFIDNDGSADRVSGDFSALNINGAAVQLSANDSFVFQGRSYRIDYAAGDGNDVALRDVTFVPGPPQPPVTPNPPTQPTGPTADALMKFGMIVTDPATPAGQVYGLYEALLNRAPDALGLESFTTALQNGASLTDVANALLNSPERGMGVTDPSAFVQSLYQNLLNRPADASGLATFTNELANGVSPATVAVQLATSAEAQSVLSPTFAKGVFVPDASEASVARLYYGLLERAPDAGGLAAFSSFIETSGGGAQGEAARLLQVASSILSSSEYAGTHGNLSDAAFVAELYEDALGRAPDGGQATYLSALASGTSRAQIAFDITQSPEAQVHLVGQIEQGALLVA